MQKLRTGYTTGSCASAAAKAAAVFLLSGCAPERAEIPLPGGRRAAFACEHAPDGSFRVQKDAGDDPDVTDKSWIHASVHMVDDLRWQELLSSGNGYVTEEFSSVYVGGGEGVGVATLPGLSCLVGHCAINPVPRRMIAAAVTEACIDAGYEEKLEVVISVPDGRLLAEKTFNPRLGIEGGISILGTTGIVEPMSEAALTETIRLELHMRAVRGERTALVTPGNYGEAFLLERMQVPLGEAVKCSNFVADAVDMMVAEGFSRVLLVGHIGKLIKVAGGMRNTHSRYGDGRMETMASLLDPGSPLLKAVRAANTTEEALGILAAGAGPMTTGGTAESDEKARRLAENPAEKLLGRTAAAVKERLESWSRGRLSAEVIVFSSAHQMIGMTERAEEYLRLWKGMR